MTDHTYREQAPKPPPPPGPTRRERLSKWWETTGRRWFFDESLGRYFPRLWLLLIEALGGVGLLVFVIVLAANWYGARQAAACVLKSPCVDGRSQAGFKTTTAPDGTPVMAPTSWCVKSKPGREGEAP